MPSQEFEQFYESCFSETFGIVREGPNEEAIRNLQGDEREEAERLLLQSLESGKDSYNRPVIALGFLRSKKAAKLLKLRLSTANDIDRIHTALALFRIEGYPESEKAIIDCLKITDTSKPDETTRLSAAQALIEFGRTSPVVNALLEAMAEDNAIGRSATTSLRTLFIDDEPVRNILGKIMLIAHDVHQADFVSHPKLVEQAAELINARLKE